jgi:hypothetical protein
VASNRPIKEYRQKANTIFKKDVLVWAPVLDTEPIAMLIKWIHAVSAAGFSAVLVFNGRGAEEACKALQKEVSDRKEKIILKWISGPASIGSCQEFVSDLFLKTKAKFMLRLDSDLQFPIGYVERLLQLFEVTGSAPPDIILAQRDEASVAGYTRFFGNVLLRLLSMYFANFADLNSGFYVMNRSAAAVLSGTPLPKYPEPRMLVKFSKAPLTLATIVVPTLKRRAGRSSIRGLWRSVSVFVRSFFEMFSWKYI